MIHNEENVITRKCCVCGEKIEIGYNNIKDAVYYDNKYYHSSCFTQSCIKKSQSKRHDVSEKWNSVLKTLNSINTKSYIRIKDILDKDSVYDFIRTNYHIKIIPSSVWEKLDKIYSGTWKGMKSGIPASHLLDMWNRKMVMLNRIYANNVKLNHTMSTDKRICYDLSVLINKYDSYLAYLEKQRILEVESKENKTENIVEESRVYLSKVKDNTKNNDEFLDLVDEIFGE